MPSMSENMDTGLAEDGSVWQKPAAAVEAQAAEETTASDSSGNGDTAEPSEPTETAEQDQPAE